MQDLKFVHGGLVCSWGIMKAYIFVSWHDKKVLLWGVPN